MKISELKNAPEWLVLARTENADVEIGFFGQVIWNSGDFRGGDLYNIFKAMRTLIHTSNGDNSGNYQVK